MSRHKTLAGMTHSFALLRHSSGYMGILPIANQSTENQDNFLSGSSSWSGNVAVPRRVTNTFLAEAATDDTCPPSLGI